MTSTEGVEDGEGILIYIFVDFRKNKTVGWEQPHQLKHNTVQSYEWSGMILSANRSTLELGSVGIASCSS